jgi:tyrosine-specific transport protein
MLCTNRLIGGILLVAGTSIGAGMLALPIISGFGGFFPSLWLLGFCWLFLFGTAFLLLEVNLSTPGEPNMISMTGRMLGIWGKVLCWITYLLLLYSLLAAYLSGASPLVLGIISASTGSHLPAWTGPLILLVVFGVFVYLGTRLVDWVNRILMIGLILTYFLLVGFLPEHVDFTLLRHTDVNAAWVALPLLFTSYGFHIVIPSLTTYMNHDRSKLIWTIFIGSAIPFLVYVVWEFLILGIVPLPNLIQAWETGESAATPLISILGGKWISSAIQAFSFFAILTSFLGVSLSLSDFLADGLKMKRYSWGRELSCLLTFAPPLIFVYAYQRGFILALQFAGIFVAILLCILPALMAWQLPSYKKLWKRALLIGVIVFSLFIIVLDVLEHLGMLHNLVKDYVSTQV